MATTDAITDVERATVAHACEDHAASWYGRQGTFTFSRSDSERYVSEGHLGKLCDRYGLKVVWQAVREHLDAHPEILAAGRLSDPQRASRQAARLAASQDLRRQAQAAFNDQRWQDALNLVDRAEIACPDAVAYERYRERIRDAMNRPVTRS